MSIERFIGQVTRDDENTVTEFLYSLMDVAYVRTIILRALLPDNIPYKIVEGIEFSHIFTQKREDDVGQPDIYIENDECFFIIEIKIERSTDFQPKQLTKYPKKVRKEKEKGKCSALIFLIPDSHPKEKQLGEDKVDIFVTKWSDFVREMELSDIESHNPIMHQFLKYLRSRLSLSTASFERGDIIAMFSPQKVFEVLEFQKKWMSFIEKIDDSLKDDKDLANTYVKRAWDDYKLGKYVSNQEEDLVFWYGYDHTKTPIEETNVFCCVAKSLVDKKNRQKKTIGAQEVYIVVTIGSLKMNGYLYPGDQEWVYFPIDSAFLYSEKMDENIKSFADTVKKLILEFSK